MLPEKLRFLHPHLYMLGLLLMAVALPFSMFLMSLSQFILAGNWILEANFKEKLQRLKRNKAALFTIGIFLIYVIGMLYSQNISEGLNQIRIVSPIFILAFILGSIPLINEKQRKLIFQFFISATLTATLYSTYLAYFKGMPLLDDVRNLSPFISHIRFSLMICLSIAMVFEQINFSKFNIKNFFWVLLIGWFVVFLFISQSVTGLGILLFLVLCYLAFVVIPQLNQLLKWLLAVFIISIGLLFGFFIFQDYENYALAPKLNAEMLPEFTSYGNPYQHDLDNLQVENGNYIWLFISEAELKEEWEKRSEIPFEGRDNKGHYIRNTIIRYLNSMGKSKDADGINKLSDHDITMIEAGHANYVYTQLGDYRQRLYQIYFEYDNRRSVSQDGQSILIKAEFWKNAWYVYKQNKFFGTGTGDLKDEFNKAYVARESSLDSKYWLISHNQYLTVLATFGILGFAVFIFLFFYPWGIDWSNLNLAAKAFIIIVALSMFSEDTLTSQAGVSFYIFFTAIFLIQKKKE
jgi:hypothetical protein